MSAAERAEQREDALFELHQPAGELGVGWKFFLIDIAVLSELCDTALQCIRGFDVPLIQ